MALFQMGFVLSHRPAPDENVAFEALHGATYGHDYRVDLHRYLTCGSKDKNLRDDKIRSLLRKGRCQQALASDWSRLGTDWCGMG